MKTIRNKTTRPLRVPLPGGKVLHLGPAKDGQIADPAAQHPGLQRLVQAGSIEILGEGERGGNAAGDSDNVPEQTHGRARSTRVRHQGDR